VTQEQACKRDGDRLVRLRATQVREEVISFERELGCERLRPQLLRLKESIAVDSPRADAQVSPQVSVPTRSQPLEASRADTGLQSQPVSAQPDDCKRDGERLARLRASPTLDQITRFEQELRCARLRPQIARLRESVGGN
jgi:hypothetical protein